MLEYCIVGILSYLLVGSWTLIYLLKEGLPGKRLGVLELTVIVFWPLMWYSILEDR